MLRTMLVPVDLCEETQAIVKAAVGLPALGVGKVVITHVFDASGLEASIIDRRTASMHEHLQALATPLVNVGLEVETLVPTGEAYQEILAISERPDIDGIMCASHGKSVWDELFIGSVTERIVQQGTKPSLFLRFALMDLHDEPAELVSDYGARLMLATDFGEPADRALATAVSLGKGVVSSLLIVHVTDGGREGDRLEAQRREATERLEPLVQAAKQAGMAAQGIVRTGEPVRELLRYADERQASGVLMGTRGPTMIGEALLGSVSKAMLRRASCPVMVVP
jgi:universal stress protein A